MTLIIKNTLWFWKISFGFVGHGSNASYPNRMAKYPTIRGP